VDFATRLLDWHALHGRHDLPWQHPRTPYRVWLSEIMLQQTQVSTVVGYFGRFVGALPSVRALAEAPADRVLALWAGLGYYTRARNLHRAAQLCVERHGGELPGDFAALSALPGIGRSTAGAILAQAHGQRHPILDGNVRRVWARHAGIDGDLATAAAQRQLWALSESRMPATRLADYTQALMDLGATVCTPRRARCDSCPVRGDCVARATGRVDALPKPRRARRLPLRSTRLLLLHDGAGRVLLERRPPTGIWGGLWSLPEHAGDDDVGPRIAALAGEAAPGMEALPDVEHAFTHFRLRMTPVLARVGHAAPRIGDNPDRRWFDRAERESLGLPSPIARLLERLDVAGGHGPDAPQRT
jgi:A/G-specific adenine glycosylase